MDFAHVGGHCEMDGCNQQDFLPFKCNLCSKNLCLLHRSTVAHSCISAGNIDIISIPCPICGKSIKMNRNDDANIEWERHFTTSCEQKSSSTTSSSSTSSSKTSLKCPAPGCTTILGPSNQIKCNTCNRQVCISHRAQDAHKCKEYQRANMLQNQSRINNYTQSKPIINSTANKITPSKSTSSTNNQKTKATKKSNEVDISNTLKGTAARRQQNHQTNTASPAPIPSPSYSATSYNNNNNVNNNNNNVNNNVNNETIEACPICGEIFSSLQLLTSHLDTIHLSSSSQNISQESQNQNDNNNNNGGREVCPQCSKRFHDIVELIQHVEKDHPSSSSNQKSGDGCELS